MSASDAKGEEGLMAMCADTGFWSAAREPDTVLGALKIAAVVGTLLILINQIDVLLAGAMPPLWKIALTYCVPYAVSTYSVAAFKVVQRRNG